MNLADRPTPRTDRAAIGFARLLIDRETANVTEIISANFGRDLEREHAALREALSDLLRAADPSNCSFSACEAARAILAATEPK